MINYLLLMKPGIILGNLVTFAAGFLLASKSGFNLPLFFTTLFALALIIASACIFNNYIDRHADQKMERTKKRALATGIIKPYQALSLALLFAIAGNFTLYVYTNLLTLAVTNIGFFVYILLYSLLKYHTHYSTLIGSIAGAIPPVTGYCAVSNQLDPAVVLLFFMMIFWQMPHFFAIALYNLEDYSKADIPLLPTTKGIYITKVHSLFYISGVILTLALFYLLNYTGILFLAVTTSIGLIWLLKGFSKQSEYVWGKQMFRWSLVMINAVSLLIFIEFAV